MSIIVVLGDGVVGDVCDGGFGVGDDIVVLDVEFGDFGECIIIISEELGDDCERLGSVDGEFGVGVVEVLVVLVVVVEVVFIGVVVVGVVVFGGSIIVGIGFVGVGSVVFVWVRGVCSGNVVGFLDIYFSIVGIEVFVVSVWVVFRIDLVF